MDEGKLPPWLKKGGKKKEVQVENVYVPAVDQVLALVDSLVPAEYRIGYDSKMSDINTANRSVLNIGKKNHPH